MSGEGAAPMTIGHGRGVSGRPDLPTAAAWSTPRTAADERARIVAYVDGMADNALRREESGLPGASDAKSVSAMLREIAGSIRNGAQGLRKGHDDAPCEPGTPPTSGSGASNPDRDLRIRTEALRAAALIASGGPNTDAQAFLRLLGMIETYLRKGLTDG